MGDLQQIDSLQEPSEEVSLPEFHLPSESQPSQSLPLTISNVTFHNFFSIWEIPSHADEWSVRYDYMNRQ